MRLLTCLGAALALSCAAQPAMAEQPQFNRGEILGEKIVVGSVPRVIVQVNGLVCDFCAQALKKVFSKEAAVDYVDVDLNKGTVQITLKANQQISDERVWHLIRQSGYSPVSTRREGGA